MQFNCNIKTLYSDHGGEYEALHKYLEDSGIQDEYSAPHTPQQNGVAERINRTLMDMTRSMLDQAGLPPSFWAEAITTAVQLRNITATKALGFKTPIGILTGRKPDVRGLRIFGCEGWMHVPNSFTEGSSFSLDFVDEFLFGRLKAEMSCIIDRFKDRISDLSNATQADMLDMFLPNSLLSVFVEIANASLRKLKLPPVDIDEFRECIIAYLRGAVYRASFTTTFDSRETRWYGLNGELNISLQRTLDVLKALRGPLPRNHCSEWEHVSDQMKGYLGRAEEMVCATNKAILLTPKTILSIDDNHIRQRSRRVSEQIHLKVVNNPKKAIGPVPTACCSALTGAFVSGHYSFGGESVRATFEKLFMFIQSARHPNDIKHMHDLIIAADRGYLSKETLLISSHTPFKRPSLVLTSAFMVIHSYMAQVVLL